MQVIASARNVWKRNLCCWNPVSFVILFHPTGNTCFSKIQSHLELEDVYVVISSNHHISKLQDIFIFEVF